MFIQLFHQFDLISFTETFTMENTPTFFNSTEKIVLSRNAGRQFWNREKQIGKGTREHRTQSQKWGTRECGTRRLYQSAKQAILYLLRICSVYSKFMSLPRTPSLACQQFTQYKSLPSRPACTCFTFVQYRVQYIYESAEPGHPLPVNN